MADPEAMADSEAVADPDAMAGWTQASPTERAALVRALWCLRWCGDDPAAVEGWGEDPALARSLLALPPKQREALRDPKLGLLRIHELAPGRRATGRYYTPSPLAQALAGALEQAGARLGEAAILDPACGAGDLLLGATEVALARGVPADDLAEILHGWDLDPVAVALAQVRLVARLGPTPDRLRRVRARLRCLDALRDAPTDLQAGATLLNPPYRTAIRHETGRSTSEQEVYAARFPLAARGAYDLGTLFLELALRTTRPGGHVALLVPQALITHESSTPVRDALHARFPLHTILHDDTGGWFEGADIRVCGVILGREPSEQGLRTSRWDGSDARHMPHPGADWGVALSPLAPLPQVPPAWPTLASLVTLKAGAAASEAYTLLPRVVDDPSPEAGLKLITTGAIDPHRLLWGERETRYLRHRFRHPRLPLDALSPTRQAQHQAPKVLVAGLSRVLEAVLDAEGDCAAAVAVLTLRVRREISPAALPLSRLAFWINSAWARAWYRRRWGGTQLGGASVQVHKGKLGALPLPPGLVGEAAAAGAPLPVGEAFVVPREEAAWPEALAALELRAQSLAGWSDASLRGALDALVGEVGGAGAQAGASGVQATDSPAPQTGALEAAEEQAGVAGAQTGVLGAAAKQAAAETLLAALVWRGGVRIRPDARQDPAPRRGP